MWNGISTAGKGNKKATADLEFLHDENIFQDEGESVLHQNYTTKKKKIKVLEVDDSDTSWKPGATKRN